jgi:hypothetical protein
MISAVSGHSEHKESIIAFPHLLAKGAISKQVFYVTLWKCLSLGKCRFLCWILLSYINYLLSCKRNQCL